MCRSEITHIERLLEYKEQSRENMVESVFGRSVLSKSHVRWKTKVVEPTINRPHNMLPTSALSLPAIPFYRAFFRRAVYGRAFQGIPGQPRIAYLVDWTLSRVPVWRVVEPICLRSCQWRHRGNYTTDESAMPVSSRPAQTFAGNTQVGARVMVKGPVFSDCASGDA